MLRPFSYRIKKSVYCRTSICKDYQALPHHSAYREKKDYETRYGGDWHYCFSRLGKLSPFQRQQKAWYSLYFPCFMLLRPRPMGHLCYTDQRQNMNNIGLRVNYSLCMQFLILSTVKNLTIPTCWGGVTCCEEAELNLCTYNVMVSI